MQPIHQAKPPADPTTEQRAVSRPRVPTPQRDAGQGRSARVAGARASRRRHTPLASTLDAAAVTAPITSNNHVGAAVIPSITSLAGHEGRETHAPLGRQRL